MKKLTHENLIVLERIQKSIPKDLLKGLLKKEKIAPVVEEIVKRGLKDKEVTEAVKFKLRMIRDSGILKKKIDVLNESIAKKIDKYVEDEIKKAVKRGDLPNREKIISQSKKYVKSRNSDKTN
jgi:hypothetical protein